MGLLDGLGKFRYISATKRMSGAFRYNYYFQVLVNLGLRVGQRVV
jgi:hypothetical protein